MADGTSIELAELIALRRYAQMVRYRPEGYATRVGNHRSRLRGRGMDFTEARNYQAGDEIRHMEWRVTARTGRPHVKVYHEERERPVVLLVDFNASMFFGTRVAFKSVTAAKLAAILAWTVARQGDRVGGLVCSAQAHNELLPRGRQAGVLPLLAALSYYSQARPAKQLTTSTLNHALQRLRRVTKPGSIVVLISDFYALDDESERHLARLSSHNDVLAYHVCDTIELVSPPPGLYPVTDGKEVLLLDTTLDAVRFDYQFFCEQHVTALQNRCKRFNIQYTQVTAESDLAQLARQTFPWRLGGG